MALGSLEDFRVIVEEEEEEVVFADVVNIIVDAGKWKVDEVEETGAARSESRMWFRLWYASVEGG